MSNTIHEVYAYLCVKNVNEAIRFYAEAFGAREHYRLTEPDGKVGHAEIYFGDNVVMLAEEYPDLGFTAPSSDKDSGWFSLHLHVDDADAMYASALGGGAVSEREPEDQFYGERSCTIRDPFGYRWMLGHSIEEVSVEDMQHRYTEMFASNE